MRSQPIFSLAAVELVRPRVFASKVLIAWGCKEPPEVTAVRLFQEMAVAADRLAAKALQRIEL